MKSSLRLSRRGFNKAASTLAIGAAATSLGVHGSQAEDNVLVFASWGGAIIKSERALYLNDFEKATGIKVIEVPGVNLAKLKTMAETGNAEWDLAQSIGL